MLLGWAMRWVSMSCSGSPSRRPCARAQEAVAALMADWGFRDRATAEAALRSRRRRLRPHRSGALRRRLEQARWPRRWSRHASLTSSMSCPLAQLPLGRIIHAWSSAAHGMKVSSRLSQGAAEPIRSRETVTSAGVLIRAQCTQRARASACRTCARQDPQARLARLRAAGGLPTATAPSATAPAALPRGGPAARDAEAPPAHHRSGRPVAAAADSDPVTVGGDGAPGGGGRRDAVTPSASDGQERPCGRKAQQPPGQPLPAKSSAWTQQELLIEVEAGGAGLRVGRAGLQPLRGSRVARAGAVHAAGLSLPRAGARLVAAGAGAAGSSPLAGLSR